MTVSTTTYNIQFGGDGSTTPFATGFEFIQDSDLVVILTDSSGVDTTQTITTHYTVTGAGNDAGGTVTMVTAPANGETLTIYRDTTLTQATDYTAYDAFPEESHEQALDKLTLIAQEQAGRIDDRIVRFSESTDVSSISSVLPVPTADYYLKFNAAGTAFEWVSTVVSTDLGAVTLASGDARKSMVVNSAEDGFEVGPGAGITAGGTADAITITTGATLTAYNSVEIYWIDIQSDNTGACTLNVDSIGAKSIKMADGTDPAAGQVEAGAVQGFWYDGTNFVLVNRQKVIASDMSANSVDSDAYVDGSIDLVHLSPDSVDGTKIADEAIDSEHYTDGSIDAEHLNSVIVPGRGVLLATHTFSTDTYSNTTFFTDNSSYSVFLLEFENVSLPNLTAQFLGCQIYRSAAWEDAANDYNVTKSDSADTPLCSLCFNTGNPAISSAPLVDGTIELINATQFRAVNGSFFARESGNTRAIGPTGGSFDSATATADGFRVGDFTTTDNAGTASPANIASGTMRIYGIR